MNKRIVLASDNSGYNLKESVKQYLIGKEESFIDVSEDGPLDYYVAGDLAGKLVSDGDVEFGIIFCGNGFGVAEAARSHKGTRVVTCTDPTSAKSSRVVNNANIVSMGGNVVGPRVAEDIVDNFISTKFAEGINDDTKAYLENSHVELENLKAKHQ